MSVRTVRPLQSQQEGAPVDVGVSLRLLTSMEYQQLVELRGLGQETIEMIDGQVYLKHSAKPLRRSRSAYHRAAKYGICAPTERLELIAGRVYLKLLQTARHTQSLRAAAEALATGFGPGSDVRQQLPLVRAEDGEHATKRMNAAPADSRMRMRRPLQSAWRRCRPPRVLNCCASRRSSGWNLTKPRS